ncbi:MFS transporter [Sesbania bispinosa]|nr:MFS transporter [Sesbania bispinosa]
MALKQPVPYALSQCGAKGSRAICRFTLPRRVPAPYLSPVNSLSHSPTHTRYSLHLH